MRTCKGGISLFLTLTTLLVTQSYLGTAAADEENDQGALRQKLGRYIERVKVLQEMLEEECSDHQLYRFRRELMSGHELSQLAAERMLYQKMVRMLTECRQSTTTVQQDTTVPTTTVKPVPSECQSATNFTDVWRVEHRGRNLRPNSGSYNCDTRTTIGNGRLWFRFTGAAGDRLLDHCPPANSCGSQIAIWSNATLPAEVGVSRNITGYGSYTSGCSQLTVQFSVMRCSDRANDLVYKYVDRTLCGDSFCGMHVN